MANGVGDNKIDDESANFASFARPRYSFHRAYIYFFMCVRACVFVFQYHAQFMIYQYFGALGPNRRHEFWVGWGWSVTFLILQIVSVCRWAGLAHLDISDRMSPHRTPRNATPGANAERMSNDRGHFRGLATSRVRQ